MTFQPPHRSSHGGTPTGPHSGERVRLAHPDYREAPRRCQSTSSTVVVGRPPTSSGCGGRACRSAARGRLRSAPPQGAQRGATGATPQEPFARGLDVGRGGQPLGPRTTCNGAARSQCVPWGSSVGSFRQDPSGAIRAAARARRPLSETFLNGGFSSRARRAASLLLAIDRGDRVVVSPCDF